MQSHFSSSCLSCAQSCTRPRLYTLVTHSHTLPNIVSPDGWECLRWHFSPAITVVRLHLSDESVMEDKERNTISPYLIFLHSHHFYSRLFCLEFPQGLFFLFLLSHRFTLSSLLSSCCHFHCLSTLATFKFEACFLCCWFFTLLHGGFLHDPFFFVKSISECCGLL